MKSSTGKWVVIVMATALIAAPVAAQTAPPQPPATAQPTAQPQSTPPQTTPPQGTASAQEHLRAASAALNDVQIENLSARAKTQVNELKGRMTALETAAAKKSVNWGAEVAAIDKILTSLLADAPATGTAASAPNKAAAAATLDDASRAKLTEVRTHLIAYAAAMAGAPAPSAAAPTSAEPPTSPQPPASAQPPTAAAPAPQAGAEVARRHLSDARNSLSALTQLPAAAQLAGDARTQVSQLITNFNELITTQSNWKDAYAKVNANMTALLGADTAAVAATTGTAGAVGTSGSTGITVDPTIREKLLEMRKHLAEFEKASGGTPAAAPANVEDQPTSTPATPTAPTTPTAPPTPTAPTTPAPTGTPGTTPAPATAATEQPAQVDWMKHMNAIELMLRSQDESGGLTLDKAKVEMLRTHLAELRKLLERK